MTDVEQEVARPLPRDVYLAAFVRGACTLGSLVVATTLLLDLHNRGAGVWAVAGVLAANTVPMVILAPVVGMLMDRFDSRTLIVVSGLWQAGFCMPLAFVTQPVVVLCLVALNSLGTALAQPVFIALTKSMVPPSQLARANGLQQGANVIATLTGPAAGGVLTGLTGGAQVPILLTALTFVVITVAGLFITTRRQPQADQPPLRVHAGITALFTDPALAAMMTLAILLTLTVHMIYVAQVFLVRDTFAASETTYGLLQLVFTVGLVTGTRVASRLHTARRILLLAPVAAATLSIGIILTGAIQSLPATFVLYPIMGAGASVLSTSIVTLLLLRTPDRATGHALATFNAIHRTCGLLAYGISGLIMSTLTPETVYIYSGTAALLVTLALSRKLHRARLATDRNLPSPE